MPDSLDRRLVLRMLAGAAAIPAAACDPIIQASVGPPPRLFRLSPKSSFPADLPKSKWQLVVEQAYAPASINTSRIGLMQGQFRFNYFANANWVDRAPIMVQRLLIESLDNSGAIVGVGPEAIGLRPDFVLKPELREFQAHDEGDKHRVEVVINARLVQLPERSIVAVEEFGAEATAPSGTLVPVVNAFDEALGRVMKRLVLWTLETGNSIWAVKTAPRKSSRRRRSGQKAASGQQTGGSQVQTSRPIKKLKRPE